MSREMGPVDLLNLFNLTLGLIGLTWLLVRTSSRWSEYPIEVRKILLMTCAVFFGLLATSAELFVREGRLLVAALIISTVKVSAIYVLATTRTTKYRTGTRTFDGDPGQDQDEDVQ